MAFLSNAPEQKMDIKQVAAFYLLCKLHIYHFKARDRFQTEERKPAGVKHVQLIDTSSVVLPEHTYILTHSFTLFYELYVTIFPMIFKTF